MKTFIKKLFSTLSKVKRGSVVHQFVTFMNKQNLLAKPLELNLLLEKFCQMVWKMEEDEQDKCFSLLKWSMEVSPPSRKMQIIPELVNQSGVYSKLIFLAKELFDALPTEDQRKIKIPMINWTRSDDFTAITEEEFLWRKKRNLKCWKERSSFRRPMEKLDLECYYTALELVFFSNNEEKTIFF